MPNTLHLSELAATVVQAAVERSKKNARERNHAADSPNFVISPDNLAISLIDLSTPEQPESGNFRGDEIFYPASIVKLFFLAAAQIQLEKDVIQETPQLLSALKDMVVDSSNEATSYVVDILTGTSSGSELPDKEMRQWSRKRQALNEIFAPLGYGEINVCQKTWDEAPYGRDRVFVGRNFHNRNCLTANGVARLLQDIVLGRIAGSQRCKSMMDLLKRDYTTAGLDPDNQATGFCGKALNSGAKLWSKAGWTDEVRHDAAYIELPQGTRLILVIFTKAYSDVYELIPRLASKVLDGLDGVHK